MPTLLPHHWLMSEIPDRVLASSIVESWPEVVEILSKPGSIAILLAGLLGLIVGWLVRGRDRSPAASLTPRDADGLSELVWRHEKLVLTERQQAEKQGRLESFAAGISPQVSSTGIFIRLRHFMLTEGFREARQKVGTDLSRMVAVRDRLASISGLEDRETGAVEACRNMAESQCLLLDSVREELRDLADEAVRIGDRVINSAEISDEGSELRRELLNLKGRVLTLPQGWLSSTEALDDQIRSLLAPVNSGEVEAVRNILLIDGSMTASLSGSGGIDLPGLISGAMAALELAEEPPSGGEMGPDVSEEVAMEEAAVQLSEFSEVPFFDGTPVDGPLTDEATSGDESATLTPDTEFRAPAEFEKAPLRNGRGFRDLTREEVVTVSTGSVEKAGAESPQADESRSLILFCSNNVELWGKDIYRGAHCRARPVTDFPAWAQWISIKRLDTGERVFAPVRTASLFNGQTSDPVGFNGTNELFYGARHLGIFSDKCPNEVETRFTYGGWGFGHRAHETAPDVEQLQAAGWEGREIPADTVFEIVIHEELPALGSQDRTLEGGGLNGKH